MNTSTSTSTSTTAQNRKRKESQNKPKALFAQGWYAFAHAHPSPNFGQRPDGERVTGIVIHGISLPPKEYGTLAVPQLFDNTLDWHAHPYFTTIQGLQVSAHFWIQRQGQLWQFVACDDRAWHAGQSSHKGRENCNDFTIGIELEGFEGDVFEDAQYETLINLCAALQIHYPIAFVTGHEHIAKGRKFDPGSGFNWQRLTDGTGLTLSV